MPTTYLFILIIGSAAQSFEVPSLQDCIDMKGAIDTTIQQNDELKGKAATACFRNLGIRTSRS